MHRMDRTSPYVVAATCVCFAVGGALTQANGQAAAPALEYQFFKEKVQAVFLGKRPGHTRCFACHSINNVPFHLVQLSPGATTWNEEQSRQNFQLIQKVVTPGYEDSRLLKHPLAEEVGGDPRHNGGQQFASKNDPDWQALRAWVMGAK